MDRVKQANDQMEDILYDMESPTIDVFDQEQFQLSMLAYNQDQLLKELSLSVGYKELVRRLSERAEECAKADRAYRGTDEEKKKKLWLESRMADHARDFVRNTVEDAVNTPRPLLKKPQLL